MNDDLIGKEILGQFRILERIGKGGMGEVFKAEQPAMDRMVAIKILHEKLASRQDLLSRFRREARAMSRLSHPNTVRVFLYGQLEETEQLYIAMEYLDGVDLAHLTRRDGPMEVTRAAKIMIQVLGALEESHGVGIVHRDLKPENILLTTQGGIPDFPKVLDFGLAKIKEQRMRPGSLVLTREGMIFGTPEFMSPEQARGETLDARSDIYSLGVIFYEMLTAKLPFPRSKPMEYIAHHIKSPPFKVTQRRPELNLPATLDPIMDKALEKNRDDRYSSAKEFAQALKALIPKEEQAGPMHSVPPGPRTKSAKTVSREEDHATREKDDATGSQGKGIVIALLVVIVILLGAVTYLLAFSGEKESATVPLLPQGTVEQPPANNQD